MSIQQEKFKAIADKIREKTGTTEKIKPNDFANKIEDVYNAGQSSMIDESKIIQKTTTATNPVLVQDVSEIPHDLSIQLYSDTITDFSGVEVIQTEKNLFKFISPIIANGTVIETFENGTIVKGNQKAETSSAGAYARGWLRSGETASSAICPRLFEGQTVTISADVTLIEIGNSPNPYIMGILLFGRTSGKYTNKFVNLNQTIGLKQKVSVTYTITSAYSGQVFYPIFSVNSNTEKIENIQIEYGRNATEYEPYKEPIIATANANGIVNGLKSMSPVTHLFSNADVNIELTYNKSWGMDYEYNSFWDAYQVNGTRTDYQNGFYSWKDECFYPKYDIRIDGSNSNVFYASTISNLKQRLEDCRIILDTSRSTRLQAWFQSCKNLVAVPELDALSVASNITYLFHSCSSLKEASIKNINTNHVFTNAFYNCQALQTFRIEGEIGKSIDFKSCPLDKASITNIIEHLSTDANITGQTLTLKESAVNEAFGIDASDTTTWTEEWINLIKDKSNSYNGNWNISFV